MATIRYTKYAFRPPTPISEKAYSIIKDEIIRNPNFEIDSKQETLWEHFSSVYDLTPNLIKKCAIFVIVAILVEIILESFHIENTLIGGIIAFAFGIPLILIFCLTLWAV